MSEALALRDRGPSGWCRAALCLWMMAAGLVTGCAPPAAPLPAVPPSVPPEADAGRLAQVERALAESSAADSVAAASMRASGLTPPFERTFVLDAAVGPLAAGLVPGGHPAWRDSLVVAIGIGARGGAALLEAARLIAERAMYQVGPDRTIMVAIPLGERGLEHGASTALARTLAVPIWDPASLATMVIVGDGAEAAAGDVRQRDLAFVPIDGPPDVTASALAMRTYEALLSAAAAPAAALRDTIGASR